MWTFWTFYNFSQYLLKTNIKCLNCIFFSYCRTAVLSTSLWMDLAVTVVDALMGSQPSGQLTATMIKHFLTSSFIIMAPIRVAQWLYTILLLSTMSRVCTPVTVVVFQRGRNAKTACFGCPLKEPSWWELFCSPPTMLSLTVPCAL